MKAVAFVFAFIGGIVGAALGLLFDTWLAMLLVGGAHSTDGRVPALGFVTVLALVAALRCVTGVSKAAASK